MSDLPSDYQQRTAADKLDLLWARISEDPWPLDALPTSVPGPWGRRKIFSTKHNRGSFEHVGDELPEDRKKIIHTWGTCARVTLSFDNGAPYTGLLSGQHEALFRFSDATGGPMFVPAGALKWPVDGQPSRNWFGLPGVPRSPKDPRPLSKMLSNAIPAAKDPVGKLIAGAFDRTAKALEGSRLYAIYLPLHHLAAVNADGSAVEQPVVADRLELHATEEAKAAIGEDGDFRCRLGQLAEGTVLFDLLVSGDKDAPAQKVGAMTLSSGFVASPHGDQRLFFQHDRGP